MLAPSLAATRRRSLGGALAPPVLSSGPTAVHAEPTDDDASETPRQQPTPRAERQQPTPAALQAIIDEHIAALVKPLQMQIDEVEGDGVAQEEENRALRESKRQLEQQLEATEREITELRPAIAGLQASVADVRSALASEDAALAEKRRSVASVESQVKHLIKQSADTDAQARGAHDQARTHANMVDSLEQLLRRNKQGAAESSAALLKLLAKKQRREREKVERERGIQETIADLRRMRSEHKEIHESVERAAQAKEEVQRSAAQLEDLAGRVKEALRQQVKRQHDAAKPKPKPSQQRQPVEPPLSVHAPLPGEDPEPEWQPDARRDSMLGKQIFRYHIDSAPIKWKRGELLGEGAFAKVYLALNEDTGEPMAVKELKPRGVENDGGSDDGDLGCTDGTDSLTLLAETPRASDDGADDGEDAAVERTIGAGNDADVFMPRGSLGGANGDLEEKAAAERYGGSPRGSSSDCDVPSPVRAGGSSGKQRPVLMPTRLEDQIAVLRDLTHPNIVRYVGTERDKRDVVRFIFLEYVSGGSIKNMLNKFGCLSDRVVRGYTRQMLMGLDYLHKRCIIHGDIKAANVLVNEKGVVKLADFGCALQFDGMSSVDDMGRSGGLPCMIGSVPWMAPEVLKQTKHGRKADIWSCGCTVVEMLTGSHPWTNFTNQMALMYHVATTKELPPFPTSLARDGADFLRCCFMRDPAERWPAGRLLQHDFLPALRRSMHARSVSGSSTSTGVHTGTGSTVELRESSE